MGVLLLWTLGTGSDGFVFLIPFGSTVLSLCLLYRISRAVGHSREVSVACVGFVAVCPPLAHPAEAASSDPFAILCLFLAIFFLIEWNRLEGRHGPLRGCVGLSAGTPIRAGAAVPVAQLPGGIEASPNGRIADCGSAGRRGWTLGGAPREPLSLVMASRRPISASNQNEVCSVEQHGVVVHNRKL